MGFTDVYVFIGYAIDFIKLAVTVTLIFFLILTKLLKSAENITLLYFTLLYFTLLNFTKLY